MKFDPYEYIGVVVPGTVLLTVISILDRSIIPAISANLTIGDLGLIIILAFVAGHLLQAVGNFWEALIWMPAGGMPTKWAGKKKTILLNQNQISRLKQKLQTDFGFELADLVNERNLTKEIFVAVKKSGSTERIDKFNRTYGLMRGVAAAFLSSTFLIWFVSPTTKWEFILILISLTALATYRMVRFGIHYARELFLEYLNLT